MSSERHVWGQDPAMDEYVHHYRRWLMQKIKGTAGGEMRVLDIACGDGSPIAAWLYRSLPHDVAFVVGVDKHTGPWDTERNVVYITADAVTFRAPEQFNLVTSFEFIEHIPHYELLKFLANMRDSLIPGGYFIGTTPIGRMAVPSENPYHVQEYSVTELHNILGHFFSGCTVEDIGLNMQGFVCRK